MTVALILPLSVSPLLLPKALKIVTNHERLSTEIQSAVSEIGLVLRQTDLCAEFFANRQYNVYANKDLLKNQFQVGGSAVGEALFHSAPMSGMFTVTEVLFKNFKDIAANSHLAELWYEVASGEFQQRHVVRIPVYFMTDDTGKVTSCRATTYVSTNVTLEDRLCSSTGSNVFDPFTGKCIGL